jgi:hypothetical protein
MPGDAIKVTGIAAIVWIALPALYLYTLIAKYLPDAYALNADIDASAANCTVTDVKTDVDAVAKNVKYVVYFVHLNYTNVFDGFCRLLDECYPHVNDTITCYHRHDTYVADPDWANPDLIKGHIIWGYVQGGIFGTAGIVCLVVLCCIGIDSCKLRKAIRDARVNNRANNRAENEVDGVDNEVDRTEDPPTDWCCKKVVTCYTQYREKRRRAAARAAINAQIVVPVPSIVIDIQPKQPICTICLIAIPMIMMDPCKHLCMCQACSDKYVNTTCPVCRQEGVRSRVYF